MESLPSSETDPLASWMESSRSGIDSLDPFDPYIPFCPVIPVYIHKDTSPATGVPYKPPPVDETTNSIALSVADDAGITLAIHKLDSQDVHWKTIGCNLIAYWADYEGSIPRCMNAVAEMFRDEQYVDPRDLLSINWEAVMDGWTCGSGTVTISICDCSLRPMDDYIGTEISKRSVEFSNGSVTLEHTTNTSSAIGVGASTALDALETLTPLTSCPVFDMDEKLRQQVLSKAIYGAAIIRSSAKGRGCCEIIRGTPAQGWRSISITDMETLVNLYRPCYASPGVPVRSRVTSFYEAPTEANKEATDLPDRRSSVFVYREMLYY